VTEAEVTLLRSLAEADMVDQLGDAPCLRGLAGFLDAPSFTM
jgi:hypothetical protein